MKENFFLKKYINAIPASFYPRTALILVMAFILSMPVTFIVKGFYFHNIHSNLLNLLGTFTQLFILLFLLSLLFHNSPENFHLEIWDKLFLGVLGFAVISALLAEDKSLALMGTAYRLEGLTTIFIYAAVFICCKLITQPRTIRFLLFTFCFSISLLSTMTLIQASPQLQSILGTIGKNLLANGITLTKYAAIFSNTNHYGYMLTLGILGLAGLFLYTRGLVRLLVLLLYAFNIWALIMNNTFGCYLAVIAGLIFLVMVTFFRDKRLLAKIIPLVLVFVLISILCNLEDQGSISNNFNTLESDLQDITNDDAGSSRIALWKQAFYYILQKPVFGHGPEGLYHLYLDDGFFIDRPHNEYLQMAAFHGIPALCMYVGALIALFIYCIKNIKELSSEFIIIGGMIFAYCFSAFFGNTMYYTTPYFLIFLGILSACKEKFF